MIYLHNPRCSKSRQGLALLEAAGKDITIRAYLDKPLNEQEINALLTKLNKSPIDIIRVKEAKALGVNLLADDAKLIMQLVKNPQLLERPILIKERSAIVGRPPEDLLK